MKEKRKQLAKGGQHTCVRSNYSQKRIDHPKIHFRKTKTEKERIKFKGKMCHCCVQDGWHGLCSLRSFFFWFSKIPHKFVSVWLRLTFLFCFCCLYVQMFVCAICTSIMFQYAHKWKGTHTQSATVQFRKEYMQKEWANEGMESIEREKTGHTSARLSKTQQEKKGQRRVWVIVTIAQLDQAYIHSGHIHTRHTRIYFVMALFILEEYQQNTCTCTRRQTNKQLVRQAVIVRDE